MKLSSIFFSQFVLPEEQKKNRSLPELRHCTHCKGAMAPPITSVPPTVFTGDQQNRGRKERSCMTHHDTSSQAFFPLTSMSRCHKISTYHESQAENHEVALFFLLPSTKNETCSLYQVFAYLLEWNTQRDLPTVLEITAWGSEPQIPFQTLSVSLAMSYSWLKT